MVYSIAIPLSRSLRKLQIGKCAVTLYLYCIISVGNVFYVPAGLIVWKGDDDELRVGNDGCPLLLPYVLERYRQHINCACRYIVMNDSRTQCKISIWKNTRTFRICMLGPLGQNNGVPWFFMAPAEWLI